MINQILFEISGLFIVEISFVRIPIEEEAIALADFLDVGIENKELLKKRRH